LTNEQKSKIFFRAGATLVVAGLIGFSLIKTPAARDSTLISLLSLLGIGLVPLGRRIINRGRRLLLGPIIPIANFAGDNFVLYLRSFKTDQISKRTLSAGPSLEYLTREEQLLDAFAPFGRVVAFSSPAEAIPMLGAERVICLEDEWESVVQSLIAKARLIVLDTGTTPGLAKETRFLFKNIPLKKVVVIAPLRIAQYREFCSTFGHDIGLPTINELKRDRSWMIAYFGLPRGFIYFDADGQSHYSPFQARYTFWRGQWHYFLPIFKIALNPVYLRHGIEQYANPVNWTTVTYLMLIPIIAMAVHLAFE